MKRITALLLVTCLVLYLVSGAVQGGVSTTRKVEHKDPVIHKTVLDPEIHRVVKGYTTLRIDTNFYQNDWDAVWWGTDSVTENYYEKIVYKGNISPYLTFVGLTQDEANFLQGLTGFSSNTWYNIDLTGGTYTTEYMPGLKLSDVNDAMLKKTGFDDYTKTLDEYTETSVTYVFDELNPFEVIELHNYNTYITIQDVVYQVIAAVFDNSPLVLDLDHNNRIDTANNDWRPHAPLFYGRYAKFFDITGNNIPEFTEWLKPSPGDGLLVMPENGRVDGALHLLGTAGGYRDGYEKLSLLFDRDGNGWVEGDELEGLMIWIDENNDAICQSEELKPLSDFNIVRISTSHKDYVSRYQTSDGAYHTVWDWWPAAAEVRKVRIN
jgi:hypothetical protein